MNERDDHDDALFVSRDKTLLSLLPLTTSHITTTSEDDHQSGRCETWLRMIPLIGGHFRYPLYIRLSEALAICSFFYFASLLIYNLSCFNFAPLKEDPFQLLIVGCVVFSSILIADLFSGIAHCCADNFGSADTPLVGKRIIAAFR